MKYIKYIITVVVIAILSVVIPLAIASVRTTDDSRNLVNASAAEDENIIAMEGISEEEPPVSEEDELIPEEPEVDKVAVISADKIKIKFLNGAEDIRCEVVYSKDTDYFNKTVRNFKTSKGFVSVKNLEPDTVYYFRLRFYRLDENKGKHFSKYTTTLTYTTHPVSFELKKHEMEIKFGKTKKLKTKTEGSADLEIKWKSADEYVATVDSEGNVTGVHPGRTKITASIPSLGIKDTCEIHIKGLKRVALTFDDGPGAYTEGLLDFLKKTPAKVTFFLVGRQIPAYKSVVKRMVKEGHEVGNHTYSHVQLTKLSADGMKKELKKSRKAYHDATGKNPTVMRPPYGSKNDTLLSVINVPCICWSVDTLDWKYRDADRNVKQLLNGATDGAIILMHDIHKTSVEGAERAIPKLLDKGVELVTVTELLTSEDGTPPEAGKNYYRRP